MIIIKRLSGFIAVLLIICLLMPCVFADTWNLNEGVVKIDGGIGENGGQLVSQGETSKTDNNPVITGSYYKGPDDYIAVFLDVTNGDTAFSTDSNFGQTSFNTIKISGGSASNSHAANIGVNSDVSIEVGENSDNTNIVLTGTDESNDYLAFIKSKSEINVTETKTINETQIECTKDVNLTLNNASISTLSVSPISVYLSDEPRPEENGNKKLNVNVIGTNTFDKAEHAFPIQNIGVKDFAVNMHSNDSGSIISKSEDGFLNAYDSKEITLENLNIVSESFAVFSQKSSQLESYKVNIINSNITTRSNAGIIMYDNSDYCDKNNSELNIISSSLNITGNQYGIQVEDKSSARVNIVDSDVNIDLTKDEDTYYKKLFGIAAVAPDSCKMNIDRSSLNISVPDGVAVVLFSENDEPEISLNNCSIAVPSEGKIASEKYIIGTDGDMDEYLKPGYIIKGDEASMCYIADESGNAASSVIIKAIPKAEPLYTVTDAYGNPVRITEIRDGNLLVLTADVNDIVLSMTPAQARALLKSGVEIIRISTLKYEYTLDLVKIVEALETNEGNIVLKTKGQDFELLIGKEDHSEFVTVK